MTHTPSKIVLITGCSSGFGLLTALHLAKKNYRVIATMRDLNKKEELLYELNKIQKTADVFQLDVTDLNSIQHCYQQVEKKYKYIDVLINNAGYGIGGYFEDLSDKEIRDQMETNFFGVQNITRTFLPIMRKRKRGKIINLSSVAAFSSSPSFGAYNASKWALDGFSESLYYELKPFGINVSLIQPGVYKTKIFHQNSRYAKNFDNAQSPYYSRSQHIRNLVMNYVNKCKRDPNRIAVLVEKIIISKNPSLRHHPDHESRTNYILKKILPFRIYSWIVNNAIFGKFKEN